MKDGQFIGQFEKKITKKELDKVIKLIKSNIEGIGNVIKVTSVEIEDVYEGKDITFNIIGCGYTNRSKNGSVVKPITKIYCYFMSQWGYRDYEYLMDLEKKGKKNLKTATYSEYSFDFKTDSQFREYRHKRWYILEGKNHYTYNTDLDDPELNREINSYFTNLFALKYSWGKV